MTSARVLHDSIINGLRADGALWLSLVAENMDQTRNAGRPMMDVTIRDELPSDAPAIRVLTDAAFRDMPYSDGDEGPLVELLRTNGEMALSLVALDPDRSIVGHIAFSPVEIPGERGAWYQLAPVSVIPHHQRRGIGSQLIETGMKQMEARGAQGIALVGNPAYYSRFGFTQDHALTLSDALDPFLQIKLLQGDVPDDLPRGQITLASAFG